MADASDRRRRMSWPLLWLVLALALYGVTRWRRDLVDFEVYRTAAVRAMAAEPLYRADDGHYQFKYLPAFALLVSPIAWGPPEVVKLLWFAINCGLVAVVFSASADLLPNRRRAEATLVAVTAVLTAKLWIRELVEGQTNLWMAALLLGAVAAVRRERKWLPGLLAGAAVFVKPYALIVVPWLAVATGIPGLVAFAVVVLGGLAAPALVYGFHADVALHLAWWRTITETTAPNLLLPENISLSAMWAKWLGPGTPASLLAALTGGALFGLTLTVFRRRTRLADPSFLEVAALLALVPILSPQGWDYVALLGIPGTMALVDRWRDVSRPWRWATGAALVVIGFTIFDVIGRARYTEAMSLSILTLAGITVVMAVLHLRWRALA